MIVDSINNAKKYFNLDKRFEKIFSYLASLTEDAGLGWQDFGDFRIGVSECETFDKDNEGNARSAEAHREYADIHYVISGDEGMGYANIESMKSVCDYNSEQDYQLLSGEVSLVHLRKGDFCLVFPEDAHIPQMTAGENRHLKKAVVKFKI